MQKIRLFLFFYVKHQKVVIPTFMYSVFRSSRSTQNKKLQSKIMDELVHFFIIENWTFCGYKEVDIAIVYIL